MLYLWEKCYIFVPVKMVLKNMPEKKYIEENNSVASEPVAEYGVATKRMSVDEYFDILHKMVDEHYDNLQG